MKQTDAANIHTFVVCAYKESPYLEECVSSVLNQTVDSRVLIATSTDNSYIRGIAEKHGIDVYISEDPSDIAGDWNFAYHQAQTEYVTLAHQDDVYCPEYAEKAINTLKKRRNPLLFFSDYFEVRDGERVNYNKNLVIKEMLLLPMRFPYLSRKRFFKKIILSMGNPICCPSVTYVKSNLPYVMFERGMKSNIDWQAWLRAARMNGSFVYLPEPLMGHRIHAGSTTSGMIADSGRSKEDLDMLRSIWPEPVAKIIGRIYKYAEDSNG